MFNKTLHEASKIEELDVKKKSIIELEKKLNERKATSHHGAVNELDGSSEKIPSGGYPIRKKDQNENGLKNDENAIVLAMETFRHDLRRIVGPEAQIIWLEQKKHEIAIEIERLQHLADADNLGLMVREVVLDYDGRFRFGAIDVENSEFKHALNAKVVLLCFSIIGALFGGLFSVFRNAELLREKALTGDYYS